MATNQLNLALTDIDVLANLATTTVSISSTVLPDLAERISSLTEHVLERTVVRAEAVFGIELDPDELRMELREALNLAPYALQDDEHGTDARFMTEMYGPIGGSKVLGLLRLRGGEEIRVKLGNSPRVGIPLRQRLIAAWRGFIGGAE